MTSIVLKEYGKISSRKADQNSKSWTYEPDLPKKLYEEDSDLQKELVKSNLIIEDLGDVLNGMRNIAYKISEMDVPEDLRVKDSPIFDSLNAFA